MSALLQDSPFTVLRKLIIRIESRHRVHIRHAPADGHREIRFLNHAAEIPIIMELIGRLVIMGVVILLEFLLAPTPGPAYVIVAFLQTNRRHADLREGKMI